MKAADVPPLRRCCDRHDDWVVLRRHLIRDFSDVDSFTIDIELVEARHAVVWAGLDDADAFRVAELIVRNRVLIMTGQLPDDARLDPECHVRRASKSGVGPRSPAAAPPPLRDS
jgi:hypothetical protein